MLTSISNRASRRASFTWAALNRLNRAVHPDLHAWRTTAVGRRPPRAALYGREIWVFIAACGLAAVAPASKRGGSGRRCRGSDGVEYLSAVHQRVFWLQQVGQAVELLEPGVGVMLAVRGMTWHLDGDDVLGHVQPVVGAERDPGDPAAEECASCLVLAPARQFLLGKQAFVLRGLLGTDVDEDDV